MIKQKQFYIPNTQEYAGAVVPIDPSTGDPVSGDTTWEIVS